MADPVATDRRVATTRAALLAAFRDLLFERGFETVRIGDIARRANVGRSTCYAHFAGREDLLAAGMAPFLAAFAEAAAGDRLPPALERVLDHLWSRRRLADAIFTGAARVALARALAGMIEAGLRRPAPDRSSGLPPRLAAIALAGFQLALVEAWLRGRGHCPPARMAAALHGASRAAALGLVPPGRASLARLLADGGLG
jgi:AcrR family transcriptional regulator